MASLSHVALTTEEVEALGKNLNQILEYVQKVKGEEGEVAHAHRNVMRADENPHEVGVWSKRLLNAASQTDGDHFASQTILKND